MNKSIFKNILLMICFGLLITSCAQNRPELSDGFVENLNSQIKSGNFEQIYKEADGTAKNFTPKEEFLEKMTSAVNKMEEIDESLSWKKDENVRLTNDYANLYFVYRKVEMNGKKLDITITVTFDNRTPEFYDLCVSPSESSTAESATCVTNALRKI